MPSYPPEVCEACGNTMENWSISTDNVLFRCPSCAHIKRDLQACFANARKHAWGGSALFDKVRAYLTYRRLKKLMPKGRVLDILEVGFGKGNLLAKFLKDGHRVHGIEADYLEITFNESVKKEGTLFLDKIENIELPKEKFDVIYGIHVIEHLDDPKLVFEKCFGALKKDGLLFFITPNSESKGLKIFKESWWNLEDPTHVRFFSKDSVRIMLEKAGFSEVKTKIPIWDSLTLEINSLMRSLKRKSEKHGLLNSVFTKLIDIILLPIMMLIRVFNPKISPSIEIRAKR